MANPTDKKKDSDEEGSRYEPEHVLNRLMSEIREAY